MSGDAIENRRSTRSTRGQHSKRRLSSPASPETPQKANSKRDKPTPKKRRPRQKRARREASSESQDDIPLSPAIPEVIDALPHKVIDNHALPTTFEPQSSNLSNTDFQSLIESAVLSVSLDRSRRTWLSGVNFTKYVARTVPKKPKDRTAEDKEAMARDKQLLKSLVTIGDCQLTLDPHIFGVVLYTTKEAVAFASNRPGMHGHKSTTAMRFGQQPGFSFAPPLYSSNYPSPVPYRVHSNGSYTQHRASTASTYQHNSVPAAGTGQNTQNVRSGDQYHGKPMSSTQQAAPDPVIHMLAQRAGTDPELKAVMKIVAAGKATPQQLEYFQGHITELTQILEARKAVQHARQTASNQQLRKGMSGESSQCKENPTQQAGNEPSMNDESQTPIAMDQQSTLGVSESSSNHPPAMPPSEHNPVKNPSESNLAQSTQLNMPTTNHPPNFNPTLSNTPYPLPSPSIPTYQLRPVYFEFAEAPGERLTFPSDSILEYLPGGRMVKFSFLIVRRPTHPLPSGYDPQKEYYQCVTGNLFATNSHILEHLSRAVKPQDEVRRFMEEVFEKCERADQRTLALRLPRSHSVTAPALLDEDATPNVPERKWARRKWAR